MSFPTNVEIKYPTETLNDTKFIHASKRETMAILLDIRTCPLAHDFINIQDAYEALGEEYVSFAMKIHSYNKALREGQYDLQKETNERKEDSDGDDDMTEAWTSLGMSISNNDNDNDY